MVVLTLSVPYEQITDGVRQKLVDALNVILGNNINLRAHLEHVRTLPGNNTEVSSKLITSSYPFQKNSYLLLLALGI